MMTSPDQPPSSSRLPDAAPDPVSPATPQISPFLQRFRAIVGGGILIILGLTALLLLGDWLAGWQLSRPWLQVSFAIVGVVVLISAVSVPAQTRPRRVILSAGGLLLILAVLDSLDGQQDILTLFVVLLLAWALLFADTTAQLLQSGLATTTRRSLAISLGIVGTCAYVGAACYYGIVNLTLAPLNPDHSLLFAFALLMNVLMRRLGGLGPYGGPLTGAVRLCPECGLRNIRERQSCKRCGARLGPVVQVS
jgi:hypothetical protein